MTTPTVRELARHLETYNEGYLIDEGGTDDSLGEVLGLIARARYTTARPTRPH
jgi:hypothetical protein